MIRAKIKFNTVDDVKKYIAKAMLIKGDIVIKHSIYVIDGKSIMGIFSLNLENELDIEFSKLDENDLEIVNSLSLIRQFFALKCVFY